MFGKWKQFLLAVCLGAVLPGVMIAVMAPESVAQVSETAELVFETQETEPARTVQYISVLTQTGVVDMPLETYITCVVLREMPADFEAEALKAQAVVARTYALRADEKRIKHADAAVCTDPSCCQGYCSFEDYLAGGGTQASLDKVSAAVEATEGNVIVYNGQLIDATYFSCSGGMTEDAMAVWGADVPYLQATESPGEESATHFTDTVRFSLEEFCSRLGLEQGTDLGIGNIVYTAGGGVDTITIGGREFHGTQLRQLLSLRSTAFTVTAVGSTVTVTTKGFGHRVGMSQYGAEAMAVQGSTYRQILDHYYAGVEITTH